MVGGGDRSTPTPADPELVSCVRSARCDLGRSRGDRCGSGRPGIDHPAGRIGPRAPRPGPAGAVTSARGAHPVGRRPPAGPDGAVMAPDRSRASLLDETATIGTWSGRVDRRWERGYVLGGFRLIQEAVDASGDSQRGITRIAEMGRTIPVPPALDRGPPRDRWLNRHSAHRLPDDERFRKPYGGRPRKRPGEQTRAISKSALTDPRRAVILRPA
jgi:hypothetical protein